MRPRLLSAALVAVLLAAAPLRAQIVLPSPQTISVVDSGTACVTAPTACATWQVPPATPTLTFQVTGTFSATLTWEATSDGATWFSVMATKLSTSAVATTATTTGQYAISNPGLSRVRARCTTYVSGGVNVTLTRGASATARGNDASSASGTLAATNGGTGQSSYAVGDLLSADTTTSLSKVPAVASGSVLASAGTSTLPAYTASPSITSLQTTAAGGIGVGIAPTSLRGFNYYSGTMSDTAANAYYGAYLLQILAPTSNTSASLTGLATEVKWQAASGTGTMVQPLIGMQAQAYSTAAGTGTLSDVRGVYSTVYNQGAGAFTNLYNLYARYGSNSAGNITTTFGLYLNPFNASSGTITTNYGIRSLTPTNGGAITTNYGARFDNAGATGITHAYGLNVQEATGAATTNVTFSIGAEPTGTPYSFYNGSTVASRFLGPVQVAGALTQVGGITSSGVTGVPVVVATGRSTAQTAANASVSTFTVGAADASFEVSANVLVTTATTHNFTVTYAYTDEGNTARTETFTFSNLTGALVTTITNALGAIPYAGIPTHIRAKASTAITIATTGTFTTVTYNVEGVIRQLK